MDAKRKLFGFASRLRLSWRRGVGGNDMPTSDRIATPSR